MVPNRHVRATTTYTHHTPRTVCNGQCQQQWPTAIVFANEPTCHTAHPHLTEPAAGATQPLPLPAHAEPLKSNHVAVCVLACVLAGQRGA